MRGCEDSTKTENPPAATGASDTPEEAEEPAAQEAEEAAEEASDETDGADVFKVSPSVEMVSHQCPATGTTIWDKVGHKSILSQIWIFYFKPQGMIKSRPQNLLPY